MPDTERLTDKMAVDMACTKEQRMYELGFISGKNKARLEVALIVAASAFVGSYFYLFLL